MTDMMKKRAVLFACGIVLVFCLFGCGKEPPEAIGFDEDVFVASGFREDDPLFLDVRGIFEIPITTPVDELLYTVRPISPSNLHDYLEVKNLVILGTLEESDPIGGFLGEILDQGAIREVIGSGAQLFLRDDWMAKGQKVAIVVGRNRRLLSRFLQDYGELLFDAIDRNVRAHIRKKTFQDGVRDEMGEIARLWNWSMDIPADYRVRHYYPEKQFVSFWKRVPDRMVFVYWEEGCDSISAGSFKRLRNRLTDEYYESDRIADRGFSFEWNEFRGQDALFVEGLWENDEYIAGGYFTGIFFCNPDQNRTYLLDACLFAPGTDKKTYIKEIEIILSTFRTGDSSSFERR
jgi:hypothetical protein